MINTIISIVAGTFVLFGSGAWSSKESAEQHKADVVTISNQIRDVTNGQKRILDLLCDSPVNKSKRVCQEGVTP